MIRRLRVTRKLIANRKMKARKSDLFNCILKLIIEYSLTRIKHVFLSKKILFIKFEYHFLALASSS